MYILPISGCGLIIVGYLALGVHYFNEAKHYGGGTAVESLDSPAEGEQDQ